MSKSVGALNKAGKKEEAQKVIAQSKEYDAKLQAQEKVRDDLQETMTKKLGSIGNIVASDVVISKDEANNEVVKTWGTPSDLEVTGEELGKLHHHQIMHCLDILEMDQGAKVAGHRGYYLKGLGVLLNQALINFGLQTLMKKEYEPVQAPFFMKKSIMEKTCQLSDFSENLYQVEGGEDAEGKVV